MKKLIAALLGLALLAGLSGTPRAQELVIARPISTNALDPLLPARMSRYPAYIVPPAYVRQVGNEEFARRPIGTGPYRVTSFVRDEAVVMEANPSYWRGSPAIRKVTWRTIPEA